MALKAITRNSTIEYIPICERSSVNPTVFILGSISQEAKVIGAVIVQSLNMEKLRKGEIENVKLMYNFYKHYLLSGIKGVRNIDDYKWNGSMDDALWDIIVSAALQIELYEEIVKLNSVGEQAKN